MSSDLLESLGDDSFVDSGNAGQTCCSSDRPVVLNVRSGIDRIIGRRMPVRDTGVSNDGRRMRSLSGEVQTQGCTRPSGYVHDSRATKREREAFTLVMPQLSHRIVFVRAADAVEFVLKYLPMNNQCLLILVYVSGFVVPHAGITGSSRSKPGGALTRPSAKTSAPTLELAKL